MNASESDLPANSVVRKIENATFTDLVFASGRSLRLSKFLASYVESEDEVRFSLPVESAGFNSPEVLIKSNSGRFLYQTVIGYAAKPRIDREAHPYIQAEVPDGRLGFACLHLPCAAVRDYFYLPKRNSNDQDVNFYELLKVKPESSGGHSPRLPLAAPGTGRKQCFQDRPLSSDTSYEPPGCP